MREKKKVTKQILKNLAKGVKIAVLGLNQGLGDPLRVIQWGPALHES